MASFSGTRHQRIPFKSEGFAPLQNARGRNKSSRTRVPANRDVPEAVLSTTTYSRTANNVVELAEACCSKASVAAPSVDPASMINPVTLAVAGGLALTAYGIKKLYDTPSRTYDENVGDEYDAWTQDGILEYYWGEHIHLGYYNDEERAAGAWSKDFIQAKFDFVDEMLAFSRADKPLKVLDVGCGIGGTSRHLAKKFPEATVTGITLSPNQAKRATQLAAAQGVPNASFQVMDALAMQFPDNSFDLVWACESGEHMPDKKKYVEEMARVLKPGGQMVIACWCQREETPERPFTKKDKDNLQFLYDEWAHPYFISIEEFERLMQGSGVLEGVGGADWTVQTLPSWRQSVWVGVLDPWPVIKRPQVWYKTTREIVTLERMHRAFDSGLMQYGMIRGTKAPASSTAAQEAGDKRAALA